MILRLTEGSLAPVDWVDPDIDSQEQLDAITILVWKKMYKAILDVVDHVSIQDLIDQQNAIGGEYYI